MRKWEIACYKQSLPFLPPYDSYFSFWKHIKILSAIYFDLDQSKNFVVWKMRIFVCDSVEYIVGIEDSGYQHFIPFSHTVFIGLTNIIPTFNEPEERAFWKTWREKEKMLVTSIFSLSHNVFHPSQNLFFFSNIHFVVCKCFQVRPVYNFAVW